MNKYAWNQLTELQRETLLERPARANASRQISEVEEIITQVRARGDSAILELTESLDQVVLEDLRVSKAELAEAHAQIPAEAHQAINTAIGNIERFHAAQQCEPVAVETAPGVLCERLIRPIEAVGLYVPAGSAPLPSTAIMLAVPARLAACPRRIICTPPSHDGRADAAVLAVATACGIEEIYKVGGPQAIAAMAYGTESIPKVDKIFGPGSTWVTTAKSLVASDPRGADIDMPAGPSEVMVIADESAVAEFVAADLLAQAEHDVAAQVFLVTSSEATAAAVHKQVARQLTTLSRRTIIEQSLATSAVIRVDQLEQAFEIANRYAPEHLILHTQDPRRWLDRIRHAGSVFLGDWTPESVGDYCSGTNHVLPTYGFARTRSGLSVNDFVKHLTVQELSLTGLQNIGPTTITLAGLEGLDGHARAVELRLANANKRTVA